MPSTLKKKNKVPKASKTKAPTCKRKQSTEELFDLDDSEVELDSLGLLFTQLIDDDYSQEEAETSHADAIGVTIVSSDSDLSPVKRVR